MRMKFLMAAVLMFALCTTAVAQQDPDDDGAADTLLMVFPVIPDAATNQDQFQIDLYAFNDVNTLVGISGGFTWSNPDLVMDSAVASPVADSTFDLGVFFYEDGDINITNTNMRFIFGAQKLFNTGLPPSSSPQYLASYYFTASSWAAGDSIVIDTSRWSQGSSWFFIKTGSIGYEAQWDGAYTIRDTAFVAPTNITKSPDSLHFEAEVGGGNPLSQPVFLDTDDNTTIPFTLTKNEPWLVPTPTSGTIPRTVNVAVSTSGLAAGLYTDVMTITSPDADNSPQEIIVTLQMVPPPPTIGATPTDFIFNAVAGEPNPASKTLTITNTGGSTLNWTVNNSEPWLSLSPSSGTDSGDVSVSVDITGLAFGEYDDTIVVSDTNATNDPVLIPVHLSVGSDLPVIEVEPALIFKIVEENTLFPDPETFVIRNGGAGTMSYSVSESSPRIQSLSPTSGTAEDTVTVNFKLASTPTGTDVFDTIWVSSPEAINSPVPVVIQFHFVETAAQLSFTTLTPQLNVYECTQGQNPQPSTALVGVSKVGGDNNVTWDLEYESDLFTVSPTSGGLPTTLVLVADADLGLPLGTYLDTIIVNSLKAVNAPETLVVSYNVVPGDEQPQALVPVSTVFLPVREDSIANANQARVFEVLNRNGGCMPWSIDNTVPWLSIDPDTGNVPATVDLLQDAAGYTLGTYTDTLIVEAPTARNPFTNVRTIMQVWKFVGDWNWDGSVDPVDLSVMVEYFFLNSGVGPKPEFRVGDVNCDHFVDPVDIDFMVNFFFNSGAPPCLNEPFTTWSSEVARADR